MLKFPKIINNFIKKKTLTKQINSDLNETSSIVRFSSYQNPFIVRETYCVNPECKCEEVILNFEEIIKEYYEFTEPIEFDINLSLTTWRDSNKKENPKFIQNCIDEFIENLTEEMKESFWCHYNEVKRKVIEKEKNAEEFIEQLNDERISNGEMFYYSQVFSNEKDCLTINNQFIHIFMNKTDCYLINDIYCINPKCMCGQVVLEFNKLEKKEQNCNHLFIGTIYFENEFNNECFKVNKHFNCSEEKALELYNKWIDSNPYIIDHLWNRYDEMKNIGKRVIERYTKGRRISSGIVPFKSEKIKRNDPCPCGSGKKYKKCCGR